MSPRNCCRQLNINGIRSFEAYKNLREREKKKLEFGSERKWLPSQLCEIVVTCQVGWHLVIGWYPRRRRGDFCQQSLAKAINLVIGGFFFLFCSTHVFPICNYRLLVSQKKNVENFPCIECVVLCGCTIIDHIVVCSCCVGENQVLCFTGSLITYEGGSLSLPTRLNEPFSRHVRL